MSYVILCLLIVKVEECEREVSESVPLIYRFPYIQKLMCECILPRLFVSSLFLDQS